MYSYDCFYFIAFKKWAYQFLHYQCQMLVWLVGLGWILWGIRSQMMWMGGSYLFVVVPLNYGSEWLVGRLEWEPESCVWLDLGHILVPGSIHHWDQFPCDKREPVLGSLDIYSIRKKHYQFILLMTPLHIMEPLIIRRSYIFRFHRNIKWAIKLHDDIQVFININKIPISYQKKIFEEISCFKGQIFKRYIIVSSFSSKILQNRLNHSSNMIK